ncbi:MAG: hypothetical protein CBR30_07190, partial [Dictyoglomus sp. NZ13-RE01]
MKSFLIFFSLLIITSIFPQVNYENSLKIVIDKDYPPFTFINEKGQLVGISVDFWRLWSERMGIKVEL